MENEVIMYESHMAVAVAKRGNYELTSPLTGNTVTLKRDVDFGVIPKTKKPSLYKAGAEKIAMAYGLLQHYTIESKIEQYAGDDPFFMYTVRCDLVKIASDGKEYVLSSGIGSANTKEKRNGFNSAFDSANSALKMAEKRSLVASATNIAGASDLFTQDIEDEQFVNGGYNELAITQDPNAPITSKQVKRLFALGEDNGLSIAQIKNIVAKEGFTSTKDITQKDYDRVCELVQKKEDK